MFNRPVWRSLVTALALSLTLAACSGGGASDADGTNGSQTIDPNGELILGTVTVPTGFDPHLEKHGGERPYWFLVFDRLTQVDAKGGLVPMLASKWETAADGKTVNFTLRDDVTFHDGAKFDAEAVKANVERAKSVKGSAVAEDLAVVDSVEVVSPTEVQFVLSEPDAELPSLVAGPAGAMISPKALADSSVDFTTDPGKAGSGPYVVDAFTPNEKTVFVPAEAKNWDPEAGRLKRLELRFIQDDRTMNSALRAGEIDVAYVNPANANGVKEAEALAKSGEFELVNQDTGVLNALLIRGDRISEPAVREAIMRSVDRDAIANDLLQGTCERSDQISRKGFPGYIDGYEDPYPYDAPAAKKMLQDAGADGLKIDIDFIAGREQIPQVLQEQLKAVGIKASLTPLSSIEVLTAWRSGEVDTWAYQIAPDVTVSGTGQFMMGATGFGKNVPALATAIKKARETVDDAERETAYQDMMKTALSEIMLVPYCHLDARYLVANGVVDFESAPLPYAQYMVDMRHVARSK